MLKSIRGVIAASLLAGCAFAATPAFAEDEAESEFTISGNAALVSQYRFRGVDLSGGDVAIQGGVDVSHKSGFYLGTWGSSIDENTVGYGHTEVDVYGGWSGDIASGVSADVGVIYYAYPNAGAGKFDYVEFYGSVGLTLGPAEATLGFAYAPDQSSLGNTDNIYGYLDVSAGIPTTPITLNAHAGYTDGFLTFTNNGKAWDWSVGADVAINENLSVGIAYTGAEGDYAPGAYRFTRDAAVATLAVSF
ncbi:MAG: TorF family putative porin [Novosphingobium sp.]|nr:TorF family putative porin [Novosphingobium sp.]